MKKRIISVILMMAMILSVGCKKKAKTESSESSESTTESTTESMTEKTESETDPETTPSTTEKPDPDSFSFTKDNYPVIDGSTSTKPMATAITSVLLGIPREEADSMLEFHKTTRSFSYLMDREAKLLICAEPAQSVFDEMKEREFEYEMEAFSAEALVFVVNASNPVESLTTEQIQKIYTGEIRNWKEVGGNDATINPYIRNANSGSQEKMETIVMNGLKMIDWPEMVGYVMLSPYFQLEQDEDGIAYTPFYYYDTIVNDDRTQVIGVNSVTPGKKTIENNSYPYVTEVMASVRADVDRSSTAYQLFYQLAAGQHNAIVKESGYIVCKQ